MATLNNPVIQYVYNLFLGYDQFFNVVLLGDPDESISGRLGRAIKSGRPKWWVIPCQKALDFVVLKLVGQENHCYNSIEPEENPMSDELWHWFK